jgi:parallel beta-helix repeat protein
VILVNCNRIRVENLTLSNTTVGAQLWNTNSTTITGSNITGNVEGVFLRSSSNNTVSGNHITDNEIGSRFYFSSSNTVSGNNITDNAYGVYLYASSNNTIYHNNFINNTYQAQTNNFPDNIWDNDYPSGGNYWSDYADEDEKNGPGQDLLGSDGIWDHPYEIDANNNDNYPLVEPWSPKPTDPLEALEELIETLETEELPKGTENSLSAKLKGAIHLMSIGNENGAIHKLMDFISQVEAQRGKKLVDDQADYLISEAQRIIDRAREKANRV